jgi:hypothetical protein
MFISNSRLPSSIELIYADSSLEMMVDSDESVVSEAKAALEFGSV